MSIRLLLLVALGAGCAGKVPRPAELEPWSWEVDRAALPELSIHPFHTATFELNARQAVRGARKDVRAGAATAFVVQHPEGLLLIDAGMGRRTLADPYDYPGKRLTKLSGLEPVAALADHIGELGFSPDDVDLIALTHLHYDHAGGIEDFPNATLWCDEREWVAAAKKAFLKGYMPSPYTGREASFPRWAGADDYGPFPAHHDLFGDGSVVLLPASGHTAGHLMVVVNGPEKSWLFTGDAAWVDANWQQPAPKGSLVSTVLEDDWKANYDVLQRISAWATRHPELVVIAGHEPDNYTGLPAWPAPLE